MFLVNKHYRAILKQIVHCSHTHFHSESLL
jgi:hypothetical protein